MKIGQTSFRLRTIGRRFKFGANYIKRIFHFFLQPLLGPSFGGKIGRYLRDLAKSGVSVLRTTLAIAGIDRSYYKIFAIGFNKTATTSIHTVFLKAGLHATHTIKWRSCSRLFEHFKHEAFSDGPPDDFAKLDRSFPRSKFILNVRDLDEWLDSRLQHIAYQHSLNYFSTNPGWADTDEAVKLWLIKRNEHHLNVLEYFKDRPDDLLIVNFIRDPDAAEKVSAFAGNATIMEKPHSWPIQKTRDAGVLTNKERIVRCLKSSGIPEDEWKTDIYCPSLVSDPELLKWPSST